MHKVYYECINSTLILRSEYLAINQNDGIKKIHFHIITGLLPFITNVAIFRMAPSSEISTA